MPKETHFVMILPRADGVSIRLMCQVMYCRACNDGIYAIGAEYVGLDPESQPAHSVEADASETLRIAGSILN
jgi:hypothetical protein